MTFQDVRGQDAAVATLMRAIERDRAHHAYRFEGPAGVGKELAAFAFAQALTCTEGRVGCGKCEGCRRAVTLSEASPQVPLHPDVIVVERGRYADVLRDDRGKKNEEKMGISIEQIRRVVLAHVGFPPNEARGRVFIVKDAHDMTPGAANALLKTLEEPRPATHFLLITSRPERLLPTIRSRSMPIRFGPLDPTVMRSLLEARGLPPDALDDAIHAGEGSIAAALEAADPERRARRRSFVDKALTAASTRNAARAIAFAESAEVDRSGARTELYGLAAHLARCAKRAVTHDPAAAAALAEGFDAVLLVTTELETANASPVLSLSRLLLVLGRSGAAGAALRHA